MPLIPIRCEVHAPVLGYLDEHGSYGGTQCHVLHAVVSGHRLTTGKGEAERSRSDMSSVDVMSALA